MPFPEMPRVVFRKNLLDRVICQVRFPPILKIDIETPAQFQESIRGNFPEFRMKEEPTILTPPGIPQEFHAEMLRQIIPSEIKNYEFSSEDNIWKVNLTRTFLSVSTKKYIRRTDFQEHLSVPLQSLIAIYKPAYFTRVGLRYIDVIRRSQLNLTDAKWKELLKPYILGLLNENALENEIKTAESQYEISLSEYNGMVRIVSGLVQDGDRECFKIDSDFFTLEKTAVTDVNPKMDFFHTIASRLIQWLIMPKLYEAMGPEQLS